MSEWRTLASGTLAAHKDGLAKRGHIFGVRHARFASVLSHFHEIPERAARQFSRLELNVVPSLQKMCASDGLIVMK
jgi:hypothetical protein